MLDEDDFVATTLSSLPPIPAYYRHMAPLNRLGQKAPSFGPVALLDSAGLEQAISSDRWVVDLRGRRVFAAEHLPGTLNLELGQNLTTYLGWLVPWDSELVLLADGEEEIAEARRLLARIGRDELYARALWSTTRPTSPEARREGGRATGSYEVASFPDLALRGGRERAGPIAGARRPAPPRVAGGTPRLRPAAPAAAARRA